MTNPRHRRRRAAQAGFTLIELMISLVLFSFAVAGVLAVAVSMVNGYREQRLAVSTEAAARSAMSYMAEALRGASPGVPSGNISQTVQGTLAPACGVGALKVVNYDDRPDELFAVFASGSVVTTSASLYDETSTSITLIDVTQISVGDTLLITDYAQGHLMQVTGIAGNVVDTAPVTCDTGTSAFPTAPVAGYAAGSLVVRAMRAHFFIEDLDGIPTLFVDPDAEGNLDKEPLAEGIEDMQIAIGVDEDGTGVVDANSTTDEWIYNVSGDTPVPDPLPLTSAVRALRITLVARAAGKVTGTGAFLRPAAEDRPAETVPDNYRRRVLTSVLEVRNLGGSP